MRRLLLSLSLVAACVGGPDVTVDAGPDATVSTFDLEVGATGCAPESALCAGGRGVCVDGVCRAQCSAVDFPRCPAGQSENHRQVDGADSCTCLPD